ncbi:hypothetical protein [Hymenobacter elongatus]|uniref:hypothetical protein n=1 Tax=Hymenobacter elongatus TaxID=877208 RepID=UPI0014369857|nr:hypothetical protein [Hymenobacter elongatus]
MNLHDIHKTATAFSKTEKMPVLFVGHGSPMNALEDNRLVPELGTDANIRLSC